MTRSSAAAFVVHRKVAATTLVAVLAACNTSQQTTATDTTDPSTTTTSETSSSTSSTSTTAAVTQTTTDAMTTTEASTMTSTTDGPTTGGTACDEDLICDELDGEDIVGCLHDCAICTPSGTCIESKETPYSCPEDCPATGCDNDGTVDALMEQCDDGNMVDEDACTNACNHNVCGDGVLFPEAAGGMEECDDGNADAGDGCSPGCKVEVLKVFVTSTVFSGALGGLAGADAQCAQHAMKLDGEYKAWLSDGRTSAASRLNLVGFQGPFVLVDGQPVAMGWSGLTSGSLLHAINKNESGADMPSLVWTNTNTDGTIGDGGDCNGWTDGTINSTGGRGSSTETGDTWTLLSADVCAGTNGLYCIQVK